MGGDVGKGLGCNLATAAGPAVQRGVRAAWGTTQGCDLAGARLPFMIAGVTARRTDVVIVQLSLNVRREAHTKLLESKLNPGHRVLSIPRISTLAEHMACASRANERTQVRLKP